ncbi:MAG: CRTAC1 family protein [Candidatus Solibacter usitatus]|nr:CRTAC1 family protein [Candidatus Solibacter usitatus]
MKPCIRGSATLDRVIRIGFRTGWAALALVAALGSLDLPIHFADAAAPSGLSLPNTFGGRESKDYLLESTGNGVAIFDFDGDGWNDVFIANGTTLKGTGGKPTSHLYRNDGRGHFTAVSEEAGFTKEGWAQGVCAGDYNNDGRTDLLVTYYGSNVLYKNLGNGKFADATREAGLPVSGTRWGAGCSFTDYDRDGHLDLFVANYVDLDLAKTPKPGQDPTCNWKGLPVMCGPRGLPMASNALYHNNGDGTFSDVSRAAGIGQPGYGLGVAAADFDNDGWPDIYVACDQTPSRLYHNLRNGKFEERGVEAGVAYNFDGRLQSGMGLAVADYDGDGFLDIAKTNFSGDLTSLYRNEDGRFFSDVSREAGLGVNQLLGWGVLFLDVDGDGRRDLVIANGHIYPELDRAQVGERYRQKTLLYRNLGNGRFADITRMAGPAFEPLRPARGMAAGDLDGDGYPEIVIVNMNETPSLLKNTRAAYNRVTVRLVGAKSNRSAIGARVTLEAGGRRQVDEVMSGGSFYSQNDLTLYFGLGAASAIDRLQVRWPSGSVQEWKGVAGNRRITAREGLHDLTVEPFTQR